MCQGLRRSHTATPAALSKAVVHAWDALGVDNYAKEVLRLSPVDCKVLGDLNITGPSLLGLGEKHVNRLVKFGMTLAAALALTQAVEDLRSASAA